SCPRRRSRKNQAPTRHHATKLIDDDRKHEAELLNARLELLDVLERVFARLSSERPQRVDVDQSWMKIARNSIAATAQHWMLSHNSLRQRARLTSGPLVGKFPAGRTGIPCLLWRGFPSLKH